MSARSRACAAAGVAATLAGLLGWAPGPAAAADTRVHNYRGVVPILVYHGIHSGAGPNDPYSIGNDEFERQMQMLARDGFHTISIAQYSRFAAGDTAELPDRPILITFDDGRADSLQAADPTLARYGMRATMFVITANAAAPKPGYLGWAQLRAMAASGRWDLQEHAHAGHVLIPVGPGGRTAPFYANLLYRKGARERFSAFKRRVSEDILTGRRELANQIPGFEPRAFALPYGDYGQKRTNYAPIPAWERSWLTQAFGVIFVQDRRVYNLRGNAVGQRYGIRSTTTAETLHQWLAQALPKSAWVFKTSTRPERPKLRRLRVGRRSVVMDLKLRAGVKLKVKRRRAGHRHGVRVKVSAKGRARDRKLRPGAVYIYRVTAVDPAGVRSPALRVKITTKR
jgi:peptidoglycan/xylan/chitin deacetylase (PgdA/CDA1 family)